MFGTIILTNETEHQITMVAQNHLEHKLKKELLIQMEREIRRVDRPRMISEMGDVTYIDDPVSELMDKLSDFET